MQENVMRHKHCEIKCIKERSCTEGKFFVAVSFHIRIFGKKLNRTQMQKSAFESTLLAKNLSNFCASNHNSLQIVLPNYKSC